jgi:lipopolysaccharide transport system permease protein
MGNSSLVKKTSFPRIILPLSTVAANLVNFLLTAAVVCVYLLVSRATPTHLEFLPVALLTQCALCLGAGLIVATLNVFFRDTEHIMGVATLAWFFLTPVFYPVGNQLGALPQGLGWMAFLNPMTGIVCAYRGIAMGDPLPARGGMALSFAICWALLLAGIAVFQRCQSRFGDEL